MSAVTLILSIDRDDDIGYKAEVDTPVIGRDACLKAAEKLGLADPEDSDTNAIFQAIKTYDEEIERGGTAEIALISGNHLNMLEGDRRIAHLLSEVIEKTSATECILISDGAEDEYLVPIIQSYLRIVGIIRITIKQLPNIEGTFYIIKKLLRDQKFARSVLVPFGIFLIIGSILAFFMGTMAVIPIIGLIGLYLLIKGLDLDDALFSFITKIGQAFKRGKFAALSYIFCMFIVFGGIIAGLMSMIVNYPTIGNASMIYNILLFIYGSIIWFVIGALVASIGKFINTIQNNISQIYKVYNVPFFILAFGLIAYGSILFVLTRSPLDPFPVSKNIGIIFFIICTIIGLILTFIGIYTRPIVQRKINKWMEKKKILEAEIEAHAKSGKPFYPKIKY